MNLETTNKETLMVRRKRTKGFSLMEILIVIALIGLVMGLLISNFDKIFGSNQEELAKTFVTQTIATPLIAYKLNIGTLPNTEEGLKALLTAPESKKSRWKGPYIKEVPLDPWKNPYQYRYPGIKNLGSYDIWSAGPDGVSDTEDDIGNW